MPGVATLKHFTFTIENRTTKETACFAGQGTSIEEAWKDGIKNAGESFRPSSSGAKRPTNTIAVTLHGGRHVVRTLTEFESDVPYQEPTAT